MAPDLGDAPEPTAGFSRRSALVKGATLTAVVWAAPAVTTLDRAMARTVGSPSPGGGSPQRITLITTYAADGTPDPLVQIFDTSGGRVLAFNRGGGQCGRDGTTYWCACSEPAWPCQHVLELASLLAAR